MASADILAAELFRLSGVAIEQHRSLAQLSTLGVGGTAELYAEPSSPEDIVAVISAARMIGVPIYIVGGGSNVLFPDGLLKGILLSSRGLRRVVWHDDDARVSAEVQAGASLTMLTVESARRKLSGLEFAFGIPGTIGGALAGNAGAGGRSIGERLLSVTSLESDGSTVERFAGEFSYSYRNFPLAVGGRFFLSCIISFDRSSADEIDAETERFRAARSNQPKGVRSAGCSFKNPPGDSAGRLLDMCGCKGMIRGGAAVSEQHANFIVNRGGASASDVIFLMNECRRRVFELTGVSLDSEIKIFYSDCGF